MLELLLAAGVFEAAAAGRATWSIQPPGAKAPLEAVKVSAPAILLAGIDPPPVALPQALEFRPAHASAPVAPQTSPSMPPPPLKSGTQLSLIPPPELPADSDVRVAPVEETPESASPEPATTPPSATFALQAPMRLNPVVRDALADAVRTLNDGMGPPTVCTVAQGVFVPLEEFGRRGVQPSLAMRALTEANMLVKPNRNGPPTLSREFNGNPTVGIVLDPRCVSGLDPAGFAAPPAEGS